MTDELQEMEARNASNRQIVNITITKQADRDYKSIYGAFLDYIQDMFPTHCDDLINFPHLEAAKATGCMGHITEFEIWEVLKLVVRGATPRLDGLTYDTYLS